MKKYFLLLVLFAYMLKSYSQTVTAPEPEYKGNIVLIKNGVPVPLEKEKCFNKTGYSASIYIVGVGKANQASVVEGISSPVRISKSDTLMLIVRYQDNSVDPIQIINFFKLEKDTKHDQRFIRTASSKVFTASEEMKIKMVPFSYKKYGTSSYLLKVEHLEPGEYALTLEGSRGVFNMFGVD